jgi:thiol-disulfide isomerase/thioredoxin
MKHRLLLGLLVTAIALAGCTERREPMTVDLASVSVPPEVKKYLQTAQGKVVLVNFWATWCGPCRLEVPGFVALQKKYGAQGLRIVGLSLDDSAQTMNDFARRNEVNYPVFLVDEDTVSAWGNFDGIPTTFLFDANGKQVWVHEGYAASDQFEKEIKKLLSSKPSSS